MRTVLDRAKTYTASVQAISGAAEKLYVVIMTGNGDTIQSHDPGRSVSGVVIASGLLADPPSSSIGEEDLANEESFWSKYVGDSATIWSLKQPESVELDPEMLDIATTGGTTGKVGIVPNGGNFSTPGGKLTGGTCVKLTARGTRSECLYMPSSHDYATIQIEASSS
jgi:hypothetical protein